MCVRSVKHLNIVHLSYTKYAHTCFLKLDKSSLNLFIFQLHANMNYKKIIGHDVLLKDGAQHKHKYKITVLL